MNAAAAELAKLRERVDMIDAIVRRVADCEERLAAYDSAWSAWRRGTERIAAERAEAMDARVSAPAPRRLRVVREEDR